MSSREQYEREEAMSYSRRAAPSADGGRPLTDGGETSWPSGSFDVHVEPGSRDIGDEERDGFKASTDGSPDCWGDTISEALDTLMHVMHVPEEKLHGERARDDLGSASTRLTEAEKQFRIANDEIQSPEAARVHRTGIATARLAQLPFVEELEVRSKNEQTTILVQTDASVPAEVLPTMKRAAGPDAVKHQPWENGHRYRFLYGPDYQLGDVAAEELYGMQCPECGVEMDSGSIRFNGQSWEHKNPEAHPQAGHHVFDVDGLAVADGGEGQ